MSQDRTDRTEETQELMVLLPLHLALLVDELKKAGVAIDIFHPQLPNGIQTVEAFDVPAEWWPTMRSAGFVARDDRREKPPRYQGHRNIWQFHNKRLFYIELTPAVGMIATYVDDDGDRGRCAAATVTRMERNGEWVFFRVIGIADVEHKAILHTDGTYQMECRRGSVHFGHAEPYMYPGL